MRQRGFSSRSDAEPEAVLPDCAAIAARQGEIAKLMARVEQRRHTLAAQLLAGAFDLGDARQRNASMPGRLGELWARFIELPPQAQAEALKEPTFHAMSWQSLLQCSPFFERRQRP